MKKLLFTLLLFACAFAISTESSAQIKRVEIVGNYLVVTDTTASTNYIDFQYPDEWVRFTVSADTYVSFFNHEGQRLGGERLYHIDSLVNSSDAAFADLAAVLTFLRANTGAQ